MVVESAVLGAHEFVRSHGPGNDYLVVEAIVGDGWQLEQIALAQEISVGRVFIDLLRAMGA
jgi:hypothetical protein